MVRLAVPQMTPATVLHELAHALVAKARGLVVSGVYLHLVPFAYVERGAPKDELTVALAGPALNLVIAVGFARIFRQNMFNCGMMAVELPAGTIAHLFDTFAGKDTRVETDFDGRTITFSADGASETVSFIISDFDAALVKAGGWVNYADANY